ncbi:putative inner membrane protein [Chlamydia trachomatis]|nr:putative inner membrane protein [Chlamydia trachomatis]
MLGWSLLIAAITLVISSLLCAIAISVYQTLTIRKLQSEVSSLERQSGVIFIEEGVEDALLSFESPFAGLEDDLVSPISPPLSPEDRSYRSSGDASRS